MKKEALPVILLYENIFHINNYYLLLFRGRQIIISLNSQVRKIFALLI